MLLFRQHQALKLLGNGLSLVLKCFVLLLKSRRGCRLPGIIKIIVGGRGWISSETLGETLDAYEDIAKSRCLWEVIRESKMLSVFLNIATLVFECIIVKLGRTAV